MKKIILGILTIIAFTIAVVIGYEMAFNDIYESPNPAEKSSSDWILKNIDNFNIVVGDIPKDFNRYLDSSNLKTAIELQFFKNGLKVSDSNSKNEFKNVLYVTVLPLQLNEYSWAISVSVDFLLFDTYVCNPKTIKLISTFNEPVMIFQKSAIFTYGIIHLKNGELKESILEFTDEFIAKALKAKA